MIFAGQGRIALSHLMGVRASLTFEVGSDILIVVFRMISRSSEEHVIPPLEPYEKGSMSP